MLYISMLHQVFINRILTFANYDFHDKRYLAMAVMFLNSVRANWDGDIVVQSIEPIEHLISSHLSNTDGIFFQIECEQYEGELPRTKFKTTPQMINHNIRYKMFHLCRQSEPVLYIDLDCVSLAPIRRFIEQHHSPVYFPTRNGGIIQLNDPKKMNWQDLLGLAFNPEFQPTKFGSDQAIYWEYFHPNTFGCQDDWNARAADLYFCQKNDGWKAYWLNWCKSAKLVHFYGDEKPWELSCPIYQHYLNTIINAS